MSQVWKGFLERSKCRRSEETLFAVSGQRVRREQFLPCVSRKVLLFQQLEKADCPLLEVAKGIVIGRDAHVTNPEAESSRTRFLEIFT